MHRTAILGFGREGKSILKFLQNRGLTRTKTQTHADEIWVLDRNTDAKFRINAHDAKKINWRLGKNYLKNLERFDIIFRSPGVPFSLPEIQRAKKSGVEISSATKLFFEEMAKTVRRGSPQVIGVTGTKGKGTTCLLLYKILKKSGFKVVLGGNIGKPMLDILPQAQKAQFVILELSSFQLQDLTRSPDIAVVLDIFPDHLDAHKSLKEYYGAKTSLGRFQKKSDAIFYFADNPLSKKIALVSLAKKFPVYPKEEGLRKNFEMATAVAKYLGCPSKIIEKTIKNFKGLEHRLELVRSIKIAPRTNAENNADQRGKSQRKSALVKFYNDSAATNPNATAFAIRSFNNPIILIAGGKDKGLDYTPLAQAIRESKNVRYVVLFGENKKKIKRQIAMPTGRQANSKLQIVLVKNLESAVKLAYEAAKKLINSSTHQLITILFSPASASFDQFKNYADRGKTFKKFVRML